MRAPAINLARFATLLGGLALCSLAGCASNSRWGGPSQVAAVNPPLVWPPPPANARIAHVTEFSSPRDLGIKPSVWNRVANFLSGGDRGAARLVTPVGVAVDEAGNLCVTDTGTGAVMFFDLTARTHVRWEKAEKMRFVSPVSVAKRGNRIFVADSALPGLVAFDTEGKFLFRITNQLSRPTGLCIQGDTLFVADSPAHAVAAYDLDGNFRFRFGTRGSQPGEFNFPTHITSNGRDCLYVTDSMNSRVQAFDLAGKFIATLSGRGDTTGKLNRPKGVAVDGDGHIYVVDALFDNFQIFDSQGRFLLNIGNSGSRPGEFWLPGGIAINQKNQIFVADAYNHRVQVFQYLGNP